MAHRLILERNLNYFVVSTLTEWKVETLFLFFSFSGTGGGVLKTFAMFVSFSGTGVGVLKTFAMFGNLSFNSDQG